MDGSFYVSQSNGQLAAYYGTGGGGGGGGFTATGNGISSVAGTTVYLGHAAAGSGSTDFSSSRFLYTGNFNYQIGGTKAANLFKIDGISGDVSLVGTKFIIDGTTGRILTSQVYGAATSNLIIGGGNNSLTGNFNNIFGAGAGNSLTNGARNIAFGTESLFSNTIGADNVSIGYNNLYSLIGGSNNVSVGSYAGNSNISGSNNIFLGTNAGTLETNSNRLWITSVTSGTGILANDIDAAIIYGQMNTTRTSQYLQFNAGRILIPVALTASANYGQVSIGGGAWDGATLGYFGTSGSSSALGTVLALNAPSGYTGDLINTQIGGAYKFKITSPGHGFFAGSITTGQVGTNGSIAINGSTSGTVTITTAAVAGAYTFTLPSNAGTANYLLATNGSGVTSWVVPPAGGSSSLSSLTAATGINTIDNLNFAQNWDWSTLTTQNGLAFSANGLTTGNILDISSTSAAGATGMKGINISLTGANPAVNQVTVGLDILNARTNATSSQSLGIRASTLGAGYVTDIAATFIGHAGGGTKFGNISALVGAMWANDVTPTTSNWVLRYSGSGNTLINHPSGSQLIFSINGSTAASFNTNGLTLDFAGGGSSSGGQRLKIVYAATASANYGVVSIGATGNWNAGASAFSGNSLGTALAFNEAAGFGGDFINAQKAGVQQARLSNSGDLGLGTTGANHASAILQLNSTTKGLVFPRLTGAQAVTLAASSPLQGCTVFVSSTSGAFTTIGLWNFDGTNWNLL